MSKELIKELDENLKSLSLIEEQIKSKKEEFEKSIEQEKLSKENLSKTIAN